MSHFAPLDLAALAAALAAVEANGVPLYLLSAYADAQDIVAFAADDDVDIATYFSTWSQGTLEDGRDAAVDRARAVGDVLAAMGLLAR